MIPVAATLAFFRLNSKTIGFTADENLFFLSKLSSHQEMLSFLDEICEGKDTINGMIQPGERLQEADVVDYKNNRINLSSDAMFRWMNFEE